MKQWLWLSAICFRPDWKQNHPETKFWQIITGKDSKYLLMSVDQIIRNNDLVVMDLICFKSLSVSLKNVMTYNENAFFF